VKRDEGFEPRITEAEAARREKDAQTSVSSPLLTNLAGDESAAGNTLLSDFILFAQGLEKLGFIYSKGEVVINITENVSL
jgi:hypothetical protein